MSWTLGSHAAGEPPVWWRGRKGPANVLGRVPIAAEFLAHPGTLFLEGAHAAYVRLSRSIWVLSQSLPASTGIRGCSHNASMDEPPSPNCVAMER